MGSVGVQEMVVIFLVALVLFGPKKLPELGRTIGKALTEFRRASNDLKATFEREMQTLERESNELKDTTRQISSDILSSTNLDFSSFDTIAEAEPSTLPSHPEDHLLLPAHDPSTVGASEVPGAESNGTTATEPFTEHSGTTAAAPAEATPTPGIEGTVPRTPAGVLPTEDAAPVVSAQAGHAEAEVPQHS
ncbi:MAG TPA: twin-arginine translocase TatA/TatE family subunit [Bryobacteraceae bacterium]|nr:twin-arginine translocase TatA/TatE family subunit [Bryobacteraceae bacterium]